MSATAPDERVRHWHWLESVQSCGQRALLTWDRYCEELNQQLAILPDLVASDIRTPRDRVGPGQMDNSLPIRPGEIIPSARLIEATAEGPQATTTEQLFGRQNVVLFGVPGAFTLTGSDELLSRFADHAPEFAARKVDVISCLSVNDPYVMAARARSEGVANRVTMLADGGAKLTRLLGLEQDLSSRGLELRCRSFTLIAKNGKVTFLKTGASNRSDLTLVDATLAAL